jgi:TetR/AcrR family transcriptional regulator, regulator of autoinduction and epiphytic fitness
VTPSDDSDPRVERSRRAILDAAIAELAEVGYGAMSIESIARRAGVGKATVYRHWRGKLDLVASALVAMKQEVALPAEGTVRERITGLLRSLAEFLADSDYSACLPALVSAAQYDRAVADFQRTFSHSRRQVLVDLIADGIASGELAAGLDPELVAETLAGPLFYGRLMLQQPLSPARVEEIVALVLD